MPKEMEHFTFQHPIKNPADLDLRGFRMWRPKPESNRRGRICNPLHNHFATRPFASDLSIKHQKQKKFYRAYYFKHLILQQFRQCPVLMARIMYQNTEAGNPLNSNNF